MKQIMVVRHGETEWNKKDVVLGRTDIPLDEHGEAQAREAGRKLAGMTAPEAVYVSPMLRTRQTVRLICEAAGFSDVPVTVEPRLIEQDFGSFEGAARDDEAYQRAKREFLMRFPGGESYLDVAVRVYPFLDELCRDADRDTVLLVTHGGICRMIRSYFIDLENEEFVRFYQPNGTVEIYGVPPRD